MEIILWYNLLYSKNLKKISQVLNTITSAVHSYVQMFGTLNVKVVHTHKSEKQHFKDV